MEIKYTDDGKKVVVLGNLNSQEKIVQEIFIVGNKEIPSGENFVVKSLHDEPAVSWKESAISRMEAKYKQVEDGLKKLEKDVYDKTCLLRNKLEKFNILNSKLKEEHFQRLIDFVSGDIKYVVSMRYGDIKIETFEDATIMKNNGRYDGIKLLTLYGKSDGTLTYKVNQYYDGSGSDTEVYGCKSYEEALETLKNLFYCELNSSGLSDNLYNISKQFNLEISDDILKKYFNSKNNRIDKEIESLKNKIEELQSKIETK